MVVDMCMKSGKYITLSCLLSYYPVTRIENRSILVVHGLIFNEPLIQLIKGRNNNRGK
jgi:hypothetical protein